MAGFVTWLRRQTEREDSVGILSRHLVRDDPAREIWTLEEFRERMSVDGAFGERFDTLAQAVVEWGAGMGISVRVRTGTGENILAPGYQAAADAGTVERPVTRQPVEKPGEPHQPETGQRTFVPALSVRGRDGGRDGRASRPWRERDGQSGGQPPDSWGSL